MAKEIDFRKLVKQAEPRPERTVRVYTFARKNFVEKVTPPGQTYRRITDAT